MALRSLGSTLLAKAQSGSPLRSKQEERAGGAVPRGSVVAQPENVVRQQIQQPIERQVPQGTQKVVSVAPTLQPRAEGAPNQPDILPGVGTSSLPAVAAPVRSQAGPSGAKPGVSARAPQATPATPSKPAGIARGNITPEAAFTPGLLSPEPTPTPQRQQVQAQGPQFTTSGFLGGILPALASLGNRVIGGEQGGKVEVPRNVSQAVANVVGQVTGNKQLQSFASNPKVTQSGVGSISKPAATVKAVAQKAAPVVQNVVRSVQRATQQAVSKATSFLRSLTRRR